MPQPYNLHATLVQILSMLVKFSTHYLQFFSAHFSGGGTKLGEC